MITQDERKWIDCHFSKMQEQITLVRIELAKLKVKSGVWGVIGGAIPVIILVAIYLIIRK
jgi:hypothetical protein